jgi:hypothetical protein
LFTDLIFLVGIGWYFLGIYHINTKGNLGWYILVSKLWQEPLFPPKRGLWTPFGALSPPFEGKRVSHGFFSKKEFPETSKKSSCQNPTSQKYQPGIPTD